MTKCENGPGGGVPCGSMDTKAPPVRAWYNRLRVCQAVGGPSMAKQEFKRECDINNIMKKFERTGLLDHVAQYQGDYGDFTDAPASYHDAMNTVLHAQEMFMTIPAEIRAEFDNDPGTFLAAVDDPAQRGRLVELGILPAEQNAASAAPAPRSVGAMASPATTLAGEPQGSPAEPSGASEA